MQWRFTCLRDTQLLVEGAVDTQDITLAIPKKVLFKDKAIATRRQTSASQMSTQMLERLVQQEDAYTRAGRHVCWLEAGADFGTYREIVPTRDEVHERA
jgi:hypothetical protein